MNETLDAVQQPVLVKVNQQPQRLAREPQVRDQLGSMNGQKLLHCLEFNDDSFLNHKIKAVAAVEVHPTIDDWHWNLFDDAQALSLKLRAKARFIRRFQEPRAQGAVHRHRCANNHLRYLYVFHFCPAFSAVKSLLLAPV